jgi:hypothetical protein
VWRPAESVIVRAYTTPPDVVPAGDSANVPAAEIVTVMLVGSQPPLSV